MFLKIVKFIGVLAVLLTVVASPTRSASATIRGQSIAKAAAQLPPQVAAQGAPAAAEPAAAQALAANDSAMRTGASLIVSLVTMGQGDYIWERFGHNALRVRDTISGMDVVFNWGLFAFDEEGFMVRLIKGEMRYWMEEATTAGILRAYTLDDRDIWEQTLNLTPAQKLRLLDLARENALPENRYYDYNYYLDNCSTRIRDLLDRVLEGRLRTATASVMTENTYRSHTRRLLVDDHAAYAGVQLVLGHNADRPISRWEEMFLPIRLMRYLNELTVPDSLGQPTPLVLRTAELQRAVSRTPELENVAPKTLGYLAAGHVIALLILGSAMATRSSPGAMRLLYTSASVVWSTVAGIAGTLALCMWLFTDHTFMYRNETLMLIGPLNLVVAVLLLGARGNADRALMVFRVATVVATLSLLAAILHLLPGLGQQNLEMIALALPANLALPVSILLLSQPRTHRRTV